MTLDHRVRCWGARPDSLSNASDDQPEGRPDVVQLGALDQIGAGPLHTCAADEQGRVACWGNSRNGATVVPARTSFQKLAAGHGFTCGLRDDATVTCWGSKARQIDTDTMTFGQLGPGDTATNSPKGRYRRLVAGHSHACAIALDGAIACWGRNRESQVDAPDRAGYVDLALGTEYSCALHESGEVECWGGEETSRRLRRFGRSADDKDADEPKAPSRPTPPETRFSTIAGGPNRVCGIPKNGDGIECFGESGGSAPESGSYRTLTVGAAHGCALTDDGSVTCWHSDEADDDSFGQTDAPEGTFEQLSAGAYHTCATRPDGKGICWGLGADLDKQESRLDFNQGATPSGQIEGR